MDDDAVRPIVLDATVLSNFASSSTVEQLARILDHPATVPAVRDELKRGRDLHYRFLDEALAHVGDDIPLLSISDETIDLRSTVRERLDPGEAESLLAAIEHDGTLATDDLAARRLAAEYDVPVTGSVGVLVSGVRNGIISVGTANEWLTTWRERRGYYAPIERLEEVLN